MAEGREDVDFHQIKIARNQEFTLSTLHTTCQKSKSLSLSKISTWQYFLTQVLTTTTYSGRKFESDKNGNPNYGREVIDFF